MAYRKNTEINSVKMPHIIALTIDFFAIAIVMNPPIAVDTKPRPRVIAIEDGYSINATKALFPYISKHIIAKINANAYEKPWLARTPSIIPRRLILSMAYPTCYILSLKSNKSMFFR